MDRGARSWAYGEKGVGLAYLAFRLLLKSRVGSLGQCRGKQGATAGLETQ